MTATTTARSVYPPRVEDVIPRAQAMADDLGRLPGRNEVMKEFKIGPVKTKAVLKALTDPAASPLAVLDPVAETASPDPVADIASDSEATRDATRSVPVDTSPVVTAPAPVPVVVVPSDPPAAAPLVAAVAPPVGAPGGAQVAQFKRRRWAVRAVLALGVAASIAGNVLHAQDNVISQVISAWSPMALLLTIELISRVPVYTRYLAVARFAATGVIAAIAAWVSYGHMAAVAARYGESGSAAYLLPLSVDGLVVVASVCLVELSGRINAAQR